MSTRFYARISGKVYGPLDGAKLKRLAAAGKLTRDDAISKDGKAGWTPAANVRGLFPPAELLPAVDQRPRPIETVIPREPAEVAPPVPPPIPAPAGQPAVVFVQAPAAPPAQQVVQQTTVVVNAAKRGNTCATLAAGLGLLSLVAAFVPVLGLIVIPAACLTLLLALFGFILALGRGGTGLVGSLGGGVLAVVAIPIALVTTAAGVGGAIEAATKAQQQARQAAEQPAGPQPGTRAGAPPGSAEGQ